MSSKPNPAMWSRVAGQGISNFGRCQLTIIWMSNIKDRCMLWTKATCLSGPICWSMVLLSKRVINGIDFHIDGSSLYDYQLIKTQWKFGDKFLNLKLQLCYRQLSNYPLLPPASLRALLQMRSKANNLPLKMEPVAWSPNFLQGLLNWQL